MSFEELLNSNTPLIVTDITAQKNDNTRMSVFINGQFAFGISLVTYEKFKIEKDKELSKGALQEIESFENVARAKNDALNYIAKKMRSEYEIRSYLFRKGWRGKVIDKILAEFKKYNYVDDKDYARAFVRDFINFKNEGIFKLRKKLMEKHIDTAYIEEVLQEYVTEEDQLAGARKQAVKKLSLIRDKDKKREKLYRFLKQKGFSGSIVSQIIEEMVGEMQND
jgi:regulatory protein